MREFLCFLFAQANKNASFASKQKVGSERSERRGVAGVSPAVGVAKDR